MKGLSFAACLSSWLCVIQDRIGSAVQVVMWMSCFRPIRCPCRLEGGVLGAGINVRIASPTHVCLVCFLFLSVLLLQGPGEWSRVDIMAEELLLPFHCFLPPRHLYKRRGGPRSCPLSLCVQASVFTHTCYLIRLFSVS